MAESTYNANILQMYANELQSDLNKYPKHVKSNKHVVVINRVKITIQDYSSAMRPDDRVYEDQSKAGEFARENLRRGTCIVEFADLANNTPVKKTVLLGMRKFSDKGPSNGIVYGASKWDSEYVTEKANGECSHFSAFTFNDQLYLIGGSKNVHLVIRFDHPEDLDLYHLERFGFAKKFVSFFIKQSYCNSNLIEYLAQNTFTLVGEQCDPENQHLVEYPEQIIKFFAFTSNSKFWTAMPMQEMIMQLEAFNLPRVNFAKAGTGDNNDANAIISSGEGAVVYCVDENDCVVKLYKEKNNWYVFRRAVREQMRKKCSDSQLKSRLDRLHVKDEMGAEFHTMYNKYLRFNAFMRKQELDNLVSWNTFMDHWIDWEKKFDFALVNSPILIEDIYVEFLTNSKKYSTKAIITISKYPGLGKSTLMGEVSELLQVPIINQDAMNATPKKRKEMFLKTIQEHVDHKTQLIIIDKTNANEANRGDYDIIAEKIYVRFVHPDDINGDTSNLRQLAMKRIIGRGVGHQTLFSGSNVENVMTMFDEMHQEYTGPCIDVDVTLPTITQVKNLLIDLHREGFIDTSVFNSINTEMIENVYTNMIEKEKSLNLSNIKKMKKCWWGLFLTKSDSLTLTEMARSAVLDSPSQDCDVTTLTNVKDLHVTVYFNHNSLDESIIPEIVIGQNYEVAITGVAWNDKCIACIIETSVKVHNTNPHITIAIGPSMKAVYSNEMLASDTKHVKMFDQKITFQCKAWKNWIE